MTDSKYPSVSDVFKLLNRSRHLPGYPLEGRSAPFFALFLRDILRDHFDVEMHPVLIPEFPLRIGTLDCKATRPNLSYNVDYVAFARNRKTAFLVELKTDMSSKRKNQEEYLQKARDDIGFRRLVKDVTKLAKASPSKRKYVHLLHQLSLAGFVVKTDALCEKAFSKSRFDGVWDEAIDNLDVEKTPLATKVVFIQPIQHKSDGDTGFEYIYFCEVARIVASKGDLGEQFAHHLLQWRYPPGNRHPRDFSLPS